MWILNELPWLYLVLKNIKREIIIGSALIVRLTHKGKFGFAPRSH